MTEIYLIFFSFSNRRETLSYFRLSQGRRLVYTLIQRGEQCLYLWLNTWGFIFRNVLKLLMEVLVQISLNLIKVYFLFDYSHLLLPSLASFDNLLGKYTDVIHMGATSLYFSWSDNNGFTYLSFSNISPPMLMIHLTSFANAFQKKHFFQTSED